MHPPRLRPLVSLLGVSLLGGALLASGQVVPTGAAGAGSPSATPSVVEPEIRLADHFVPTCIGACKHPTNAAKVFRWGLEEWEEEAEQKELDQNWRSNHPKLVNAQQGMLTIHAERGTNVVRVWPDNNKEAYGRWEARVRAVEVEDDHKTFTFNWELVPVKLKNYHCGAQSIVMASYRPGDSTKATGAVRTLKDRQFTYSTKLDLRSRAWHTYAVEVTKKRISWFVDTKVLRTERRDAALSGIKFKPRFRIHARDPEATMNKSRMQMDWVRYYDLDRPNAKPVKAPRMRKSTYRAAC